MSLRASHPLQHWLQLRRVLSGPSHIHPTTHANTHFILAQRALALAHVSDGNSHCHSTTKRPLHSTSARCGRPSPSVRSSMRHRARQTGEYVEDSYAFLDPDGVSLRSIGGGDEDEIIEYMKRRATQLYHSAKSSGVLPKGLGLATFREVSIKLVELALETRPTKNLIRGISKDVDTVFKIGYVISKPFPPFLEWVLSACALDGSRAAVVLLTARNVKRKTLPRRSEFTDKVATLAMKRYPPAILLEVVLRDRREQYEEALELLENHVIPYLKPRWRQPPIWDDITFSGALESPWRLYAILKERMGQREETNALLEIAAKDFQDRDSMVDYAAVLIGKENPSMDELDMYEEYMSKAAAAGNTDAIIRLANFYFLTSKGRYPIRGRKDPREKPKSNDGGDAANQASLSSTGILGLIRDKLSPFLNRSMSPEEYRKLAIDWYDVSFNFENATAALMLAILLREDGRPDDGWNALTLAELDPRLNRVTKPLRQYFYEERYEPNLPLSLLEV